jgi:hypothetical protein
MADPLVIDFLRIKLQHCPAGDLVRMSLCRSDRRVGADPLECPHMEWEFLRHPAFWVVVLILALAWKAGSIMEHWHEENVRMRKSRRDRTTT